MRCMTCWKHGTVKRNSYAATPIPSNLFGELEAQDQENPLQENKIIGTCPALNTSALFVLVSGGGFVVRWSLTHKYERGNNLAVQDARTRKLITVQ